MINKQSMRNFIKFVIIVLCILIIARIFALTLARYQSIAESKADVDVAFYLVKEDYKTMTLNLESIVPRDNVYIYNFEIGNQDGDKKAEIDIEYDLTLRTTTNLPLSYELYKNQLSTDSGAVNIIKSDNTQPDEDGTYFKIMTTDTEELKYKTPKTNSYQLVMKFPANYNTEEYQDIIEMIEITVDSHQKTS